MGPAKRCTATELLTALTSPTMKPQVLAQLSAESITTKALSKEQLKQYLDTPPAGEMFASLFISPFNLHTLLSFFTILRRYVSNTVKPAYVVTSIKGSPALSSNLF